MKILEMRLIDFDFFIVCVNVFIVFIVFDTQVGVFYFV